MSLKVVILAAGQGTRMCSSLPKVLHRLAGNTLIQWVIDAAESVNPDNILIVYGHGGDHVKASLGENAYQWVEQAEQLGTGHAMQQVAPFLNDDDTVLVLNGDVPLISSPTLQSLITQVESNQLGLLTADFDDPYGFGRIVRNQNNSVTAIVEEKDATDDIREISEINTGIMLLPAGRLKKWLSALENFNQQNEYYLTDVIAMAVEDGIDIKTAQPELEQEVLGVNTRVQLAELESFYQVQSAEQLMLQGVTLIDPARFDLRGELDCAQDVTIDINVIIEGKVIIAEGCTIGANVILKNASIGQNTKVLPNSIIEDSTVGEQCLIGPYARLRPGTELSHHVKVGNFVETKKTVVGQGSKIPHLSYIGDADIGEKVNIGAGVITANYDGVNKSKTIIGDNVFVGCDSQLIAPVTIGEDAYIACGSSISKDAPAGKLSIARAKQKTITGWQPPKKIG